MRILGIDPGLSGGAAIWVTGGDLDGPAHVVGVIDIPIVGEGAKRRIDVGNLRRWIVAGRPDHAFIERAGSMPREGVASAFRYGRAAGAIEAVVACCNVPISIVEPGIWKRFHRLYAQGKEASRQRAIELAPGVGSQLARKRDHGRAEAILIALYGARTIQQAPAPSLPLRSRRSALAVRGAQREG